MVKRVASSPTLHSPVRRISAAVASAMCSSGILTAASIAGATLCIVFVHSTRKSAPAASSDRAAAASKWPASSQRPECCSRSMSWKSTL